MTAVASAAAFIWYLIFAPVWERKIHGSELEHPQKQGEHGDVPWYQKSSEPLRKKRLGKRAAAAKASGCRVLQTDGPRRRGSETIGRPSARPWHGGPEFQRRPTPHLHNRPPTIT